MMMWQLGIGGVVENSSSCRVGMVVTAEKTAADGYFNGCSN